MFSYLGSGNMEKWPLLIIPILIALVGFLVFKKAVNAINKRNKSESDKTIHWEK